MCGQYGGGFVAVCMLCLLPMGSLLFALFCCNRFGWGWDTFIVEANAARGTKVKQCVKPLSRRALPAAIVFICVCGMITFQRR